MRSTKVSDPRDPKRALSAIPPLAPVLTCAIRRIRACVKILSSCELSASSVIPALAVQDSGEAQNVFGITAYLRLYPSTSDPSFIHG